MNFSYYKSIISKISQIILSNEWVKIHRNIWPKYRSDFEKGMCLSMFCPSL
jgi:hypothetical protein